MCIRDRDKEISHYYAAWTNMHSVGVMGDERTYDYAVALRAVTTTDFMTAESYNMPVSYTHLDRQRSSGDFREGDGEHHAQPRVQDPPRWRC